MTQSHTLPHLDWFISQSMRTMVHVDSSQVLKELRGIPSCDDMQAFYCREWAMRVFKFFFAHTLQQQQQQLSGNGSKKQQLQTSQRTPILSSTPEIPWNFTDITSEDAMSAEFICTRLQKYLHRSDPFDLDRVPKHGDDLLVEIRATLSEWVQARELTHLIAGCPQHSDKRLVQHDKLHELLHEKDFKNYIKQVQVDKNGFSLPRSSLPRIRSLFSRENLEPKLGGCHDRHDITPDELEKRNASLNSRVNAFKIKLKQRIDTSMENLWKPVFGIIDSMQEKMNLLRSLTSPEAVSGYIDESAAKVGCQRTFATDEFLDNVEQSVRLAIKKDGKDSPQGMKVYEELINDFFKGLELFFSKTAFDELIEKVFSKISKFMNRHRVQMIENLDSLDEYLADDELKRVKVDAVSSLAEAYSQIVDHRIDWVRKDIYACRDDAAARIQEVKALVLADDTDSTLLGKLERIAKKRARREIKKLETFIGNTMDKILSQLTVTFPSIYLISLSYTTLNFFIYVVHRVEGHMIGRIFRDNRDQILRLDEEIADMYNGLNFGMEDGTSEFALVLIKCFESKIEKLYHDWDSEKRQESLLKQIENEAAIAAKNNAKKAEASAAANLTLVANVSSTAASKKKKKKKNKTSASPTPISTPAAVEEPEPVDDTNQKPEAIRESVDEESEKVLPKESLDEDESMSISSHQSRESQESLEPHVEEIANYDQSKATHPGDITEWRTKSDPQENVPRNSANEPRVGKKYSTRPAVLDESLEAKLLAAEREFHEHLARTSTIVAPISNTPEKQSQIQRPEPMHVLPPPGLFNHSATRDSTPTFSLNHSRTGSESFQSIISQPVNNERIEELEARNTDLQNNVTGLLSFVKDLQGQIAGLSSQNNELMSNAIGKDSQIADYRIRIRSLESQLAQSRRAYVAVSSPAPESSFPRPIGFERPTVDFESPEFRPDQLLPHFLQSQINTTHDYTSTAPRNVWGSSRQ